MDVRGKNLWQAMPSITTAGWRSDDIRLGATYSPAARMERSAFRGMSSQLKRRPRISLRSIRAT